MWNPFSHDKTDWFDPQWMFGIKEFDIVIGNPPYIKEYTNKKAFDSIRGKSYYQGKMDLWYAFACYSLDMLSETGIQCFIAQNNWTTSSGASILRNKILKETQIKLFTDFGNYKVFKTAGIQTMVYVLQKSISEPIEMHCVKLSILNDGVLKDSNIIDFLDFKIDNSFAKKSFFELYPEKYLDKQLTFNETAVDAILNKIERLGNFKLDEKEVAQGIVFPQDFINKSTQQILGDGSKVGDGVFVLSNAEKNKLDLSPFENRLIKPLYTSHQLKEFYGDPINKFWVIYTSSEFKNSASISQYPNLKTHLDKYSKIITSDNKPYGLHRARDERFFNGEKIVAQRKCPSRPSFTYTDFDCYVSATFNVIKTNRINLKYLTALLNSKLIRFWLRHKGKMQGDNYQIDKEPLLNIPIFRASDPQILIEKTESILFKKSLTLDISPIEQKMDDIIFNLYELAEDEIKLINEEL
ncbi:Eco57I restriction-modification methylase domain-containing protein [Mucilaginibacter sp. NFX135]|uniref:Eco57I restriction-modification methylase domain-containing protein n=1 Tax=Mucilaginibacter sp. NFX135 TaxID=3402687 RepID=UPI003AFA2ADC